jgi:hypothetical protein
MGKSSGPKTATSTSDVNERFRPIIDENLALASTISNMPFLQFQGGDPRAAIANFSNDQLSAFDQVRGMNNRVNPMLDAANATTAAAVQGISNPNDFMQANYQDPYQQDVIDNAIGDVRRERDAMNETARLRSPYGGTRQALTEAANNRNYLEAVGDLSARERSRNFGQAAGLTQNAMGQLLGAGGQLGNMAANAQNVGLTQASAQSGIGQQVQGQDQAYKDYLQSQFFDAINHPLRQLGVRMGAVGQTPLGTVQRTPIIRSGGGLGSALGGAGSLLSGIAAICWVAREVFGETNPKWLRMRDFMLNKASPQLFDKYVRNGPAIAEKLKIDPARKEKYRVAMDAILAE